MDLLPVINLNGYLVSEPFIWLPPPVSKTVHHADILHGKHIKVTVLELNISTQITLGLFGV